MRIDFSTSAGSRLENQDNAFILNAFSSVPYAEQQNSFDFRTRVPNEKPLLLGVLDGVGGGHINGAILSQLAAQTMHNAFCFGSFQLPGLAQQLRCAALCANEQVRSACGGSHLGGTTLCAAAIWKNQGLLVALGDSPAYLLQGRVLRPLYTPQNLWHQKISEGQKASPADASHLLAYLGMEPAEANQNLVIRPFSFQKGDCLLLCSDGLALNRRLLGFALRCHASAKALADTSRFKKSSDNTTVMIVRF